MLERIEELRDQARTAIEAAPDAAALEEIRVRYLGRKAELTTMLRGIGELPPEERGPVGQAGNQARGELEALLAGARGKLEGAELDRRLTTEGIDVTLPGTPPVRAGHLHPLTRTRREIEDVFVGLGYRVVEGPEVEHDYYNFTSLNYEPGHPARMLADTFYVDPASLGPEPDLFGVDGAALTVPPGPRDVLLRTHTSPGQVRGMESAAPPIFIVMPGRTYRRDSDATHTPMFHQVEGLAVGEGITLADLKGTLLTFARAIFGPDRDVRIRPHYFPFTEPSVEVDVSCFRCSGTGELEGERCSLCKGTGWLEILGAGMVDPNVFGFVREHGYDPERVQGFAFGGGIERIAMLKHGVPDLRMFFENDVRLLEQFRVRVPVTWLRELCDPGLEPDALAERLSMTGTEVERISGLGVASGDRFVVGRVLTAEPHPDADRLRVCTVDAGDGEPRTIVCGAPNVAAGQTVAVALPGAVMPDGNKLGTAKLRGIESSGMILSETEMELGEDTSGIAVLDGPGAELEPGSPLSAALPIAETVLELEITPNRPDCLGIFGVAREVHAITGADLAAAPWESDATAAGDDHVDEHASVRVEVPDLCPRFTARAFADVTIGPSPLWLKARLIACGQRPINNVVDITNYVMLLTGQPLHAFDLDRVPGGEIIVRAAAEGERMKTLDDVERELDSESVLVCDRERPSGIAGIMGGQVSEVSDSTTRVLLEAANWNGKNILRTSNLLSLRSEASTRFEKQLHPDLTMRAQAVASRLLVEFCGARLVPGTIDVDAVAFPPRSVSARPDRIGSLLGMDVPRERAEEYLERLGFGIGGDAEIEAAVPADRYFDTVREVDLIEEVARVHGIDEHLPATLPEREAAVGGLERHQQLLRRLEDLLRDSGLDEAITWSFVDPGAGAELDPDHAGSVAVHNPLSAEQAAMRTDLIGGLLAVGAHNLARGAERVALFESGRVYLPVRPPAGGGPLAGDFAGTRPAPVAEPHRIGALLIGPLRAESWRDDPVAADFYDVKGLVELIVDALGVELELEPATRPFLHPARAAAVLVSGQPIGWLGELHPSVLNRIDASAGTAFELDAGPLMAAAVVGSERFDDVTTFPAIEEDLAVVVARELPAGEVLEAVRAAAGELLRSASIFDVYEGEQVPDGKRSLALRLEFRAPDRTLTDAEVAERRAAIVEALAAIGGSLRG